MDDMLNGGSEVPRVTPDAIEREIIGEDYWNPRGTLLTVCVLKLANGFTVTGESACVSPALFDENVGKHLARDDARRKIWRLLGFRLADKLSAG